MNRSLLFSVPFLVVCTLNTHPETPPIQLPPMTFNIHVQQTSAHQTDVANLVQAEQSGTSLKEHCFEYGTALWLWIKQHTFLCTCGILVGSYCALRYQVYALKKSLNDPHSWSAWHQAHSLETLLTLPQQDLAQTLMCDIQRRYTADNNPTDVITPLVEFRHAVETELQQLKKYQSYCTWLQRVRLHNLLGLSAQTAVLIQERIDRLAYVKSIFSNWCTNCKLDHLSITPPTPQTEEVQR